MKNTFSIVLIVVLCVVALHSVKSFLEFSEKSSSVYKQKPDNSFLSKIPTEKSLK